MLLERCPKCNARIAPTDTHCMDCGTDLLAHQDELKTAATKKRALTDQEKRDRAQAAARAAARGRQWGVERSDETRLRVFDQQEAERMQHEMLTAWATAGIALVVTIGLLVGTHAELGAAGGWAGLKLATPARIRELQSEALGDHAIMGALLLGLTVSALLCAVGQTIRATTAMQSIAAVKRGEKPLVVSLHGATRAGLMLGAAVCPPAGIIIGVLLKLSRDEETRGVGGQCLVIAGLALLVHALNIVWGLAGHMKSKTEPKPEDVDQDAKEAALLPLRYLACWVRTRSPMA